MASIVDRGTRSAPKFFAKYDFIDASGERKQRWKLLAGVQTKKQATQELARVEREVAAGRDPFPERVAPSSIRPLLDQWGKSLKNRNADDDRSRTKRQLVPRFGKMTLEQITLPVVMTWIDELGESGLSPQTQRHALNTLSRFFSWCIERGLATINPVRMVPVGKRPTPPIDRDQPWLEDETTVPELVTALGNDLGLAFYLANRSGMRLGEVVGLRMGDLDFLADGVIRVAHSYGGPLKEDRTGEGKVKWIPAPSDAEEMLKLHLARRRLNGAKADDLVFMPPPGGRRRKLSWAGYRKESVEAEWDRASAAVGVTMSWYQATRHTAVSRALKAGVPLDQVSAAVGHASPETTRRSYAHYVRKDFAAGLRLPMPATKKG